MLLLDGSSVDIVVGGEDGAVFDHFDLQPHRLIGIALGQCVYSAENSVHGVSNPLAQVNQFIHSHVGSYLGLEVFGVRENVHPDGRAGLDV